MSEDSEVLLEATTQLVPPLLTALDALGFVGRNLHPPNMPEVVGSVAEFREPVLAGLEAFAAISWPEHLAGFAEHVQTAAKETLEAYDGLDKCLTQSNPAMGA